VCALPGADGADGEECRVVAIYHFSVKIISRADGKSAVAAAAYRTASRLVDERTGTVEDYRAKSDVLTTGILAADDAPAWVRDRERLWNAVEAAEKRKDSQLARDFVIALPNELDPRAGEDLVRRFAEREMVALGMVVDYAIHSPDDGEPNLHAHLMATMRRVDEHGFGKKERAWNDVALLERWRESWARDVNDALEHAGIDARVDHRSYEAQGVDRAPTEHLGPAASALERKGVRTERGEMNRAAQRYNAEREQQREIERERVERRERDRQRVAARHIEPPATPPSRDEPVIAPPRTSIRERVAALGFDVQREGGQHTGKVIDVDDLEMAVALDIGRNKAVILNASRDALSEMRVAIGKLAKAVFERGAWIFNRVDANRDVERER
jgi:hypothetical protein